ncbi:hypothetical protein PTKIN_Ptkin19aG0052900 [Pterospermum kingtungense]
MLVGPVGALFMDNISTGLDSSTTYQIVNSIKQSIHIFNKTAIISLLQPPPETFELYDDIILLSEGRNVYQGPREYILEFFESMGFKCPERKGIAHYLQEITSSKDQRQYWFHEESAYRFISVNEFAESFKSFHIGLAIQQQLANPFDRSKSHPAALTKTRYGASKKELMKACLSREVILFKRNAFLHVFKMFQLVLSAIILATVFVQARKHHRTVEDGTVYLGALYFGLSTINFSGFFEFPLTIDKLPIFYKQRDLLFYPSWAFSLPTSIVGVPISIFEVALWVAITYYTSISVNEFLSETWKQALNGTKESLGVAVLKTRGVFTSPSWYWIGLVHWLVLYSFFNGICTLAFAYLDQLSTPPRDSEDLHFRTKYAQSYFTQFKACLWKQHKSYWRNTPHNAVRLFSTTAMSIIFGVLFWNLGSKRRTRQDIFNAMGAMYTAITFMGMLSGASIRQFIIAERTVFYRERAAGIYSALVYAIAQVAIEIPYTIAQVALYGFVVYSMMGFEWTASEFFLNTFFMFITVLLFIYFGIMIVAVSPSQAAAAALSSVFYSMWNLFSGFIIPRPRIFVWWRWYAWVCPVAWSLWRMATSQYGDLHAKLESEETVAHFMDDYNLGLDMTGYG